MKYLTLLIAFISLIGCSGFRGSSVADSRPEPAEYRLMAGDVVELKIAQRQDLNGEYTLAPDGSVYLPEIGTVAFKGLSQSEAQDHFHQVLSQFYTPVTVSLKIREFQASEYVVIIGEVSQPGTYRIENEMTLLQLIGEAAGFTRDASLSNIKLIRNAEQESKTVINLSRMIRSGDISQNPILRSGDLIVVSRKPLRIGLNSMSELLPFAQLAILVLVTFSQVK